MEGLDRQLNAAATSVEFTVADPVAASATVTAVFVLLYGAVFTAYMIALTFEIVAVAGSAERRVLREWIAETGIHAVAVATAATGIVSVITRIVALRVMAEAGWSPAVSRVTGIALHIGCQMVGRFEGRHAIELVVAIVASADRGAVVHPAATTESRRGVADRTVQAGRDVGRIGFCVHADCSIAIVAGSTVVDDTGVIKGRRHKPCGVMTDAAILIGDQVICGFASGKAAVMTGSTIVDNACVIKTGRAETGRLVAVHTVLCGRNMIAVLAGCGQSVMAAGAVAGDALVVESCVRKRGWRMTD